MKTSSKLLKSSAARTSFALVSLAISFYMLPFLVGKLGEKWYGILTIVGSLNGYYYLMDFGLSTAVTRYISQYIANKDTDNANSIINTSLIIYSLLGLLIITITAALIAAVPYMIQDQSDMLIIRLVLLITGLNLAVEFPYKAFAGIVGAYVRYDLLAYAQIIVLIVQTGLVIFFLTIGYGIITVVLIGFCCSQISNIFFYLISRHLFKGMKISRKYYKREKVRELFGFSIWAFIITIGNQLRFRIDALVIGSVMSAAYVTHYFIGARIADLFQNLVSRATAITTPVLTRYHAQGKRDEICEKFLFLTKINVLIAVFGGGLIITLGKPFITRWVGESFVDAYPVLIAMMISMVIDIINAPSRNVLFAISMHKYLAIVNLAESFANVGLSLFLVHYYGILGVALGTVIPIAMTRTFLIQSYVCRCIKLPLGKYYSNIAVPIIATLLYLGVFYLLVRNVLLVPVYWKLILAAVSAIPGYLLCVYFIMLDKSDRILLRNALPAQWGGM